MRLIFYSKAEINEAFHHWAPKLREFAASCRLQQPLPERDSLSAAHREQYRILQSVLTEFRDSPIRFPDPYLDIYHGSPITVLAAQDVFGSRLDSIVLLVTSERNRWFQEIFRGADGWFGSSWVTVHEQVPEIFAADVAQCFPKPDGFDYWVLTKARAGSGSHELLKWDGTTATPVGIVREELVEEGFVEDLYW